MNHRKLLLAGLVFFGIAIHIPFLGRAFNIDDPLNIYISRHILQDPFNPYNFTLVYNGIIKRFYEIYANPPLNGYFLALPVLLFNENEIALHIFNLIYPFIVSVTMFLIARKFLKDTKQALIASILIFISPGVFIVSQTIMPDIQLLCVYLLAVYFYMEADNESKYYYLLSGLCASAACLLRYSGLTLIPLLFIFFLYKKAPRSLLGIAVLMFPVFTFILWKKWTLALYGPEYWSSIVSFQTGAINVNKILMHLLANLSCLGGTAIFAPMFLVVLFGKKLRVKIISTLTALCVTIGLAFYLYRYFAHDVTQLLTFFMITFPILTFLLSALFYLKDWIFNKDRSIILLFWIALFIVFNSFFQHTAVKYNILAFPALILLFLLFLKNAVPKHHYSVSVISIILTGILALFIAAGDMNFANSYRNFTQTYYPKYKNEYNKIFYLGDWGFNYYMRKSGGIPIESWGENAVHKGDIVFMPSFSWPQPIPDGMENNLVLREIITVKPSFPVYTMNGEAKAFFWANYNFPNHQGVLPFSFGTKFPIEQFYIHEVL